MNPKIWTPRYLKNRIGLFTYEQFNKDKPWIAPTAISWLDKHLTTKMKGVEFGSGRSTVWYAKRLKSLVSIEDHKGWFEQVQQELEQANIKNISYVLRSSEEDTTGKIPYVQTIDTFEVEGLDFIVVDGKHRDVIAIQAIDKLKSGGFLLLDDAERYVPLETNAPYAFKKQGKNQEPTWKEFSKITKYWKQKHFSSGVSDTVIFIKP